MLVQYASSTPCVADPALTLSTLITLECDPSGVDGVSFGAYRAPGIKDAPFLCIHAIVPVVAESVDALTVAS